MNRHLKLGRLGRIASLIVAAGLATTFATVSRAAPADDARVCPSSTDDAYDVHLGALTGPAGADLTITVAAAAGCARPDVLKKIQLKTFAADGSLDRARNLFDVDASGGVARGIDLGDVPRDRRIEADVLVQTGTPKRTDVLRGATRTLLRPDLVVEEIIAPQQTLVGRTVVVRAVIGERNGDVGADALVSLSAIPGASEPIVVPPGGRTTVIFPAVSFGSSVPVALNVKVDGAAPAETDAANNDRIATLDVTEHELPTPRNVLFPSLLGYGAQFGMHLYAPITPWPAGLGYGDVEDKVKRLEPQLVRIFYNDNWDANANGQFPGWAVNYASFVKSVQLAQEAGATIDISFQNLGNIVNAPRIPPAVAMAKFADVLEELVRTHGLTNVRWAEVGNEPNGGGVSLDQCNALYRALHAELVARGLREQIQLMGGGLVENHPNGIPERHHYEWMKWIAANMSDVVDGYAEHVYWWYDRPGRLEYRLRDTYNLMRNELSAAQRKPDYMMEFGIRGYSTCSGKPPLAAANHLYYRPGGCADIWRTNIAGFQQLWFNIASAQLGVAGTAKWDAFWGRYDNSSVNNQLYWMIGPPTEGSPLTPTYHAMSLLFHVTEPGWQIIGLEPWESNDWSVERYRMSGGDTSDDQPEKELVGYAGPNGELTLVGLDTHGQELNGISPDPPSEYSIGGLPAHADFKLAVWNATGDGTNSIVGTVTTNAAGVARFEVPLQAAFALTTVPMP
jgi:hypothetical protein